jgi:chromosome segregation ATPase
MRAYEWSREDGSGDSMSGVNGPDIVAVYQLLTEVAHRVAGHDSRLDSFDRKLDGIAAHLADHDRKLDSIAVHLADHDRKLDDLAAGLTSLREAVTHYHSTVIGHGILISELDERVRRIARHLKLEPAGD